MTDKTCPPPFRPARRPRNGRSARLGTHRISPVPGGSGIARAHPIRARYGVRA